MPPDRELALEKYRHGAETYDHKARMGDDARRRAVASLRLRPGDVVLDVGCGTGLSLPLIEEAIGPEGRIIGIDQSSEMLGKARERVESTGWQNVTLIESAVDQADITDQAHAVLFCFTHDIMRTPKALHNVFRHVRPGGRAVATGIKWAPWWALPVNAFVWYAARQTITTFEGFGRPWSHLERFVPDLTVEPASFGALYFAWGTVPAK